jgi:hypothetical protein
MTQQGQAAPEAPAATAPAAATDTSDPIARIGALLESGDGALDAPEATPQEPEAPTESEGDGEESAPDATEEVVEQETAAEMAEIPLDKLEAIELEVKVKGEDGKDVTEKRTIKELTEGYMRQKDYSRKTAEVARQREEVPEKIRQGVESERNSYLQQLQLLESLVIETVAPELKNVDWNTLATSDPFEYVRLQNRSNQMQQTLNGLQAKRQEITKKQEAEKGQTLQKVAQQSRQVLEEKIPGWSDDLYQQLMTTAVTDYGYKRDEVAAWLDPKAFQVLHDAAEYRKMKATKPIVDKRVVNVPKVVKSGTATSAPRAQTRQSEAIKKLQSSGQIRDAAAVIRSRLG